MKREEIETIARESGAEAAREIWRLEKKRERVCEEFWPPISRPPQQQYCWVCGAPVAEPERCWYQRSFRHYFCTEHFVGLGTAHDTVFVLADGTRFPLTKPYRG